MKRKHKEIDSKSTKKKSNNTRLKTNESGKSKKIGIIDESLKKGAKFEKR